MNQEENKKRVAQEAVSIIFDHLRDPIDIGIGTGTTVNYFIGTLTPSRHLINRAVSSSSRSTQLLKAQGIEVVSANDVEKIVVYVDGADEVDSSFALIKGGGGAHTQEKIVTALADEFICLVDETKLVEQLGAFPVPVEVLSAARNAVIRELRELGGEAVLRKDFVTEDGNLILDIHGLEVSNPDRLEVEINSIPGVVEVGIFARNRPQMVLLGGEKGVEVLEKKY